MQITVVICVKTVRDLHTRHHHLKNFERLQNGRSLRLTTRGRTTVLHRVHEKQDTQPVLFCLPNYHDINHIMTKNRTHHLSCFSNQIMIHQKQDTQPVMSFLPKYNDIDLVMLKNRTDHLSCFSSQTMMAPSSASASSSSSL